MIELLEGNDGLPFLLLRFLALRSLESCFLRLWAKNQEFWSQESIPTWSVDCGVPQTLDGSCLTGGDTTEIPQNILQASAQLREQGTLIPRWPSLPSVPAG